MLNGFLMLSSLMSQPRYGLPMAAVSEDVHTPVALHASPNMSPAPSSYQCLLYICLSRAMSSCGLMMVWCMWVSPPFFMPVPEPSGTVQDHSWPDPTTTCYSNPVLCACYTLHSFHLLHSQFCVLNVHTYQCKD